MRYIDVRPFKHVTTDVALPLHGWLRWSALFSSVGGGTRLTFRCARAQCPNPLATRILRLIGNLFHKKRLHAQFRGELEMLEEFISGDSRAAPAGGAAPTSLSEVEINVAARNIAAGEA